MGRTDSNISPLIAAQIDEYEDRLYALAVAGMSENLKFELLDGDEQELGLLPSESLGLGTGQTPATDDAQTTASRLIHSRVSLENIAAADAAVGDAKFFQSCLRVQLRRRK
jgi:hypothetical protein